MAADEPRNSTRIHALLVAMTAAALVYLGAAPPVTASPITYQLSGATATFGGNGTDSLTGTFTFDPSGPTLDAVDVTVTGAQVPGVYSTVLNGFRNGIFIEDTQGDRLDILFSADLTSAPDLLTNVIEESPAIQSSTAVTGSAIPQAPEPATLTLLGGALALLYFTCRASHGRRA